ncbi:MAG: flagellin N-terminal helical domain-containing protein [Alphaproteobacteria bacterium]
MVESINLSAAQQSSLTTRNRISYARDQAAHHLATGRKISQITEDAQKFLLSKGLVARVDNLNVAKSNISQGISALEVTQAGLDAADKLAQQLKGIATQAQNADADDRATLAAQFDSVRTQLDTLIGDVSYKGVHLLSNPADTLRVQISEQPSESLNIDGVASDASGLGIGTSAGSYGSFATTADIDNALAALDSARSQIRSTESSIVGNAGILGVREEFTENLANIVQAGADKLVAADLNEEAAILLSANVRDSLALEAQNITTQSAQLVVGLLER